jgi:UDP-N-acetyl-D-mannosaminuronic acid dehydrogenase
MSDPLKICVVGTGHIGLPLAAVLADAGFSVVGYDTNDDFVTRVNTTGSVDFQEEGLSELLAKHLHRGLTLTSTPPDRQDIYVITVGTPLEVGQERPHLDRIRVAVQRIAPGFGENPLVVLRSTVSIGTTRRIVLPEIRRNTERFGLAFARATIEVARSRCARSADHRRGRRRERRPCRGPFRRITRHRRVSSLGPRR